MKPKNDFLKNLSDNSNNELIDLLKNRQNESVYDAIIAAKEILEKRNIDTTQYQIREKNANDEKKFNISTFLSNAAVFLIFFVGFGISGIYLIVTGLDESHWISVIMGFLLASVGFGQIILVYLSNIKWLNFITYIPAIIIGLLSISTVIGLAIIPFSSNLDLSIDLGILILKDGFVRFALIILDLLLAYKLFEYLKNRIYERNRAKFIENEIKSENK